MGNEKKKSVKVGDIKKDEDGLIGKFFHSLKDGDICWQGQVLSEIKNDYYLVQLYEWLLGSPNKQVLVPFSVMVTWQFYDTAEQMEYQYEETKRKEGK